MRLNHQKKPTGFTLIEMVGVLAVIAILAAILVPKIFSAIEESRYNNTVASCNSVKAAVMSYFAKEGKFPAKLDFDQDLITGGYLENPFTTRIGTDPDVVTKVVDAEEPLWNDLDGTGAVTASGTVVYVKLGAIAVADAYELSRRIDGVDMSAVADPDAEPPVLLLGAPDTKGRVIYEAPDGGQATCYIYLAHK